MAPTPPGRRGPDDRRRQIRRAARNGFLWFAGLWLLFRNAFRRARRWGADKVRAMAQNRPVALGAAGGIALMTVGLVAYAALSDEGYSPRLMPLPPATTSARSPLPSPVLQPTPSPEPSTIVPTPPPLPPAPPTSLPPPVSPVNPPLPLPPPAEPSIPPPFESTAQPSPRPAPTPSPTSAPTPSPTQTCIFTPDGERCQNPDGLVKNSKTPPGQTRAPH